MFQRDYILRMVEQASRAIARALGLLLQQKHEAAEAELATGYAALGFDRELIGVLDAATFARHFGDDDRIEAAVRLLLCDARLGLATGAEVRARRCLRLARGLLQQLAAPPAELAAELEEIARP